jgi:hypothetical protein
MLAHTVYISSGKCSVLENHNLELCVSTYSKIYCRNNECYLELHIQHVLHVYITVLKSSIVSLYRYIIQRKLFKYTASLKKAKEIY